MCGIAGYYSRSKVFRKEELKLMTDAIKHRGPDAEGFFHDEYAGLGHRRLSILDLSESANQPMTSHSGKYVIVYNGEIYNFREIAKDLNLSLNTSSDTEVILEAFEKHGPEFVNQLNGMFAIAIYEKQSGKLFLFRDRIGIKPLFYFFDGKSIAFASEIKALNQLAFIRKNRKINHKAINQFLHLGYIPEPNTIFENIRKFPSGHYFVFNNGLLEFKEYWQVENNISEHVCESEENALSQLEELLNDSVKSRLISDVPVGTLLSGGIDSSLVTALAQKNTTHNIKTFSIGFKESKFNESEYARAVAKHLGTDHHEFILSEKEAMDYIEKIIPQYDEPYADTSAVPTMIVSEMARKQVTVTLSGDGGDELFHGYGAYNWANRLNKPLINTLRYPISSGLNLMSNRHKRAAKVFKYPEKKQLASHIFSQEQYFFSKKEISKILTKEHLISFDIEENIYPDRELTPSERQAIFDLRYYLKDDLLVKVDRASMKYSLENRVPLLDHRLVEFALNISPELKMKGNIQKYLLKELLYKYVPKELFDRPKWGFGIPLIDWLKTDLSYLIDELKNDNTLVEKGIINENYMNNLIAGYISGKDYLYNRIWQLVILNRCFKNYI